MSIFNRFLQMNPGVKTYPELRTTGEYKEMSLAGIDVVTYEGAPLGGLRTKIYAHVGFPENTGGKVPAVVLVHGGGGHPEDAWIKHWNARGYAAIAMDTTGFFPTKPIPHLYEGYAEGMERRLAEPFAEDGFTVGPDNSRMTDGALPLEEQWMYHAVASVILANNLLRNDPRVDADRIGICGISWGSVITSIAIGYDSRFAFAIPIYGSGYLRDSLAALMQVFKQDSNAHWLAESRFSSVKMPVMWMCWNDDSCFSIQSNARSYLETEKNNPNTCLSILHDMRHSHKHAYRPPHSYWFADRLMRGVAIPAVEARYEGGEVQYSCTETPQSVRLFYITEPMTFVQREKYGSRGSYMAQEWQMLWLDPKGSCAALPEDAVGCYVEFGFEDGVVLTTPYVEK